MATHSGFLPVKSHGQEEARQARTHAVSKSQTEQLKLTTAVLTREEISRVRRSTRAFI